MPEEFILKENFDVYYRNGNEEYCTWEGGKYAVPPKIYKTKIEDLNLDDLLLLKTNDLRREFLKRNNIVALAKFGEVIDTYENYPENDSWIKSEYKIIDMHKIVPAKSVGFCGTKPMIFLRSSTLYFLILISFIKISPEETS